MSQAPHAADRRTGEMRNFVADVEGLAASVRDGRWPRLGHIEGSDATGSVFLAIDDRGAFAAVHLDQGWWRALGPDGLAGALREADANARAKLAAARLVFRRVVGPPPPAPPLDFEFRHQLSDTTDYGELISSWHTTMAESYQRVYEFDRNRAVLAGEAPKVVSGPEGLVRISLVAGAIADVEVAHWRLSEASTDQLAADIRAALHSDGGIRP
jgi:hypothetical protein